MEKAIKELQEKFETIKEHGYIKSINNNKNGSGLTLEHCLGSSGGDICIPDFKGIEIKTMNVFSNNNLNLFSSSPDGKYILPTQWLANNYGYPDKNYRNIKVIKGKVGNTLNKIGLFYYYSLIIDKQNEKIRLCIFNKYKRLVNSDLYWDFDSIKDKLERKLSYLAVINNKKTEFDNQKYYSYTDIRIYKLKSFNKFLDLIENDIIKISFKTGVYKSGRKAGKFHDHGTGFEIPVEYIEKLFIRIY